MTMTTMPAADDLLRAEGLTVFRDKKAVLKDVTLGVGEHDFVTVIGPNGAGKTTLLKYLIGLHRPNHGAVVRRKGLRVGYVPQRAVVERAMPINTGYFLRLNKTAERAAADRVIAETGIAPLLKTPLYALSGGEWQRVLLARALLESPQLLALDEPSQGLDVSGQLAFYELLDSIYKERRLAILMVSHDLHLVMSRTKRVVCLFHHVCCAGAPQSVTRDPEFISLFGKDMAQLMAVYHHSHNHVHHHIGDDV